MRQVETLEKIIDKSDALIMLAEIEDGYSVAAASMYITTREYKREDFANFRKIHGDIITVACITIIAKR